MQYSAKDKATMRKEFSTLRKNAKSTEKDRLIVKRILSDERILNADIILMYASFGSEVDTWEIAENLLKCEKTLAFPLCHEKGIMTFHIVSSLTQLTEGNYGIREPKPSLPCPDITSDSVCIVPGLAFTVSGGRLGYGGGFYDRFISEHQEIYTIALTYEVCITNSLPIMQHDIKVKAIASEERMVFCNDR